MERELKSLDDDGIAIGPKPQLAATAIILEGCYLFMHLLDRQAFSDLSAGGRRAFVDATFTKTFERLGKLIDDTSNEATFASAREEVRAARSQMWLSFGTRTEEYGTLATVLPGPTEGLGKSLIGRYVQHGVYRNRSPHHPSRINRVALPSCRLLCKGLELPRPRPRVDEIPSQRQEERVSSMTCRIASGACRRPEHLN